MGSPTRPAPGTDTNAWQAEGRPRGVGTVGEYVRMGGGRSDSPLTPPPPAAKGRGGDGPCCGRGGMLKRHALPPTLEVENGKPGDGAPREVGVGTLASFLNNPRGRGLTGGPGGLGPSTRAASRDASLTDTMGCGGCEGPRRRNRQRQKHADWQFLSF